MNKYLQGICWSLLINSIGVNSWASTPIFLVTPNVTSQSQLVKGQTGTAIYQVTNNSGRNLTNIGIVNLPAGVSLVSNAGYQYCSSTFNLNAGTQCLIKLQINSNVSGNVQGGPKVCFSASQPVYCSQPLDVNQMATQVTPGPISESCTANIANFNSSLAQIFDSTTIDAGTIQSWGPARNQLFLSSSNPNLTACTTTSISNTANIAWMQNRVLAAEDYWVKRKMNYCHHHVPDFATPVVSNGTPRGSISGSQGGYCSTNVNLVPGSTYGQVIRWNYSGTGSETASNWINNNAMWYGIDCSDFTSFIYNFAFGIQFNSDTGYQAGQASNGSQDNLTPNGQSSINQLQPFSNSNPNSPAGVLVCKNGQTEQESPECGGFGTNGYFSVFLNNSTSPTPSNITPTMLTLLQPGDLLFLGFAGNGGNNPTSMVTHVITWTGKKVGFAAGDVNPSQIAPEEICPNNWQPQVGDWVIIDSHYQGADYRVFSQCFYQNNIWGVRRVVGYMS